MKSDAPNLGPGNRGIRPSPPENDPHNSREETDAPTSPESPPRDKKEDADKRPNPGFGPEADR